MSSEFTDLAVSLKRNLATHRYAKALHSQQSRA